MGSTICVKCGSNLIPYSYCDICRDVLRFTCSSCSTNTDERIHIYCKNNVTINNNHIYLQDEQQLIEHPKSPQMVMDDSYLLNSHYNMQKQFNDEIRDSSIKLSTSYWDSVFESVKLLNGYWKKILDVGINNFSIT